MDGKPTYEDFMRRISQNQTIDSKMKEATEKYQRGELENAENIYKEILQIDPRHADALHQLGLIAHDKGDAAQAVDYISAAIQVESKNPIYHNNLGTAFVEKGNLAEASACYQKATELNPAFCEAYNNLGIVLEKQGLHKQSAEACTQALNLKPDYAPAHSGLGTALYSLGDIDLALHHYCEAVRIDPDFLEAYNNLGELLEKLNRVDEARKAVDNAIRLQPNSYKARLNLATLEYRDERYEEACSILAKLLEEDPSHPSFPRAASLMGLACDKLGHFERAFKSFLEGNHYISNSSEAGLLEEASMKHLNSIEYLRRWFSSENISAMDNYVPLRDDRQPVFLVGFPRSGTTLVDQILAAHSSVRTIEEKPTLAEITGDFFENENRLQALISLSTEEIDNYRLRYWERVNNELKGEEQPVVTVDKLPLNIIWLGLICRFFPQAKVIVALRDPRDVIISNFMQDYELNRSMYHFLTLETTATFYAAVMGLYIHYREVLPMECLEIHYEDLVFDTVSEIRRILDFLNLSWEEPILNYHAAAKERKICTPSYKQVVKPIYTEAVARWVHYRSWLEPVLPVLKPVLKILGYDT
ncbi:MAG: sulfotransferase [Thermodesulfobacteriota bacterium]|nr:sulfotransferase [Thermodesulfobacteriota bacterium]